MGSPTTEEGRQQFPETQHHVTVGNFWLAETEVTQAQWKVVMGGNPSDFKGDDRPVEKVNWYDVQEFSSRNSIVVLESSSACRPKLNGNMRRAPGR